MLIKKHKIYTLVIASFFLSALLPSLSFAELSEKQTYKILNSLLANVYDVSFEAEELLITFSDSGAPEINRYKIGRMLPDKMRRETYRLDGSVEELMVQDEDVQIVSYPDKKAVIRSLRIADNKNKAIDNELVSLIRKNYHIKSTGRDTISGRSAIVVVISPKEAGSRPSFRVWIDHETSLPLKTETYSFDGSLSFLSTLSAVVINPSFPSDYFVIMVPHGTKAFEAEAAPSKNSSNPSKKISAGKSHALKGGYFLKETGLSESGNIQSIYHDGINNISLFSEDLSAADLELTNKNSKGNLNNVKREDFEGFFCSRNRNNILSFISEKQRYILVGEVSKKALIDIAMDLKSEVREK